jgi:hypothetical protein
MLRDSYREHAVIVTAVAILALTAGIASVDASQPRTDAQWLMYQHDRARTGRTPAVGTIKAARLAWKLDPSGVDRLLNASRAQGHQTVSLPASKEDKPLSRDALLKWDMGWHRRDISGKSELVDPPNAEGARWGKFLPAVPGLQRLSSDLRTWRLYAVIGFSI